MFTNRFFGIQYPLYSPDDNEGADEVVDTDTAESDLDLLNKEDEEDKDKDEDTEKPDEEDESKSEDEDNPDDDEEEKPKKDDETTDTELVRASYKDVTTKYPQFFKDFPELKTAFFREQEFTKVFPRVADAKLAAQEQSEYEEVKEVVLGGDAETFLNNVGSNNPTAMKKFANNFLPALEKLDEQTYYKVTAPVLQNVLHQVFSRAKAKNDENVMNAARVANFEIFGTYDLGKPETKGGTKEKSDEEKDFEEKQAKFYSQKHTELRTAIVTSLDTAIDKEIEKGLDPTNSLTSGLKKLLIKTIKAEVDEMLAGDTEHTARMDSLWKRERAVGYSGRFKDSIVTAYLSRAKALIPKVRAEKRSEILNERKRNDGKTKEQLTDRVKRPDAGDLSKGKSKVITVKDAKEKKMSDLDILNA
jgi:hypothetical protein